MFGVERSANHSTTTPTTGPHALTRKAVSYPPHASEGADSSSDSAYPAEELAISQPTAAPRRSGG